MENDNVKELAEIYFQRTYGSVNHSHWFEECVMSAYIRGYNYAESERKAFNPETVPSDRE